MTADTVTGEIVETTMPEAEARERLARVRSHVTAAWDDLIALHARRAWVALGHASWEALCDAELDGARIALPRQERREVVGQMRQAGMSTRAIGQAIGVSKSQVDRDLSTVPFGTVGESSTGADAPVERPATVTSLDGRKRPASQPSPVAAAKHAARTSPRVLGGKAIDRFRDAYRTVDVAGGVDTILDDSDDLDAMAASWLTDIERSLDVLNEWRSALLRRRVRSVQ